MYLLNFEQNDITRCNFGPKTGVGLVSKKLHHNEAGKKCLFDFGVTLDLLLSSIIC